MPRVTIEYQAGVLPRVPHDLGPRLLTRIATIVADALNEPGAEVSAEKVEITANAFGMLTLNVKPLHITVEVRKTDRRSEKKDELGKAIAWNITSALTTEPEFAPLAKWFGRIPSTVAVWIKYPEAVWIEC